MVFKCAHTDATSFFIALYGIVIFAIDNDVSTSAFVMPMTRGADATYANMESYNKMIFDDNNQIIGYEINQGNKYPCMFSGSASAGTISGLGQGR